MSQTEIYCVSATSCEGIGSANNAYRRAMYVWEQIAVKYFGLKCFPSIMLDRSKANEIWNANKYHTLLDHELIVLKSTMDNVTVKTEDVARLIQAFETYGAEHPDSSFTEHAAILKFCFLGYDEETEETIYSDLSDAWDLFEHIAALSDCNTDSDKKMRIEYAAMRTKLTLFESLADNGWDLISQDDEEVGCSWVVVGHYIIAPWKRVLGVSHGEHDPEHAIRDAINTTKDDEYAYLFAYVAN